MSEHTCKHNPGYYCTACWPDDYLPTEDAINEFLVPSWALAKTQGELVLGANLPTKDGRKIGNAHIVAAVQGVLNTSQMLYTILTDAGTEVVLNSSEITELFYPPEYISDVDEVLYKFSARPARNPETICCNRARASNGWHHNEDCKNWVLVY